MKNRQAQVIGRPLRLTRRGIMVAGLLMGMLMLALTGCTIVEQPIIVTPVVQQSQPSLSVNLGAGDDGLSSVTVAGQGWPANSPLRVSLTTAQDQPLAGIEPFTLTTDAGGRFSWTVLIPAPVIQATTGQFKASAQTTDGQLSSQAFFNLSPAGAAGTPIAAATATTGGPSATPTPFPPGDPVAVARTGLNIRGGPGVNYAVLGTLEAGDMVEITGVSANGDWWQIRYPDSPTERAWIAAQFVQAQNVENVAIAAAPAIPTATANLITDWRGEYFNNTALSGSPALVRNDETIDFDWGTGSPGSGVGPDNFSARWTQTLDFDEGLYHFYVTADDGIRLWVDDRLLIDAWGAGSLTSHTADMNLSGSHSVRLEYNEQTSEALAELAWFRQEGYPDWKGEYFDNLELRGAPVLVRNDPAVRFGWGPDSPGPGVPADGFSARWSRRLEMDGGTYRFNILVDDGARLWIDGNLLIDQWRSGEPKTFSAEISLSEGPHDFRIDYFDNRFDAQIHLSWEQIAGFTGWKAEYFANRNLSGNPDWVRNVGQIDYAWGVNSPGGGLPADNFSVRWTREANFEAGTYRFTAEADDGIRLWLDDQQLINDWQDGQTREHEVEVDVEAGTRALRVEYYESTGNAEIRVSWEEVS